jgi:hypothetical protein
MGETERKLGVQLLEVSGIYGAAAFSDGIGFRRVALVGLVGRARGLLRALHHLLDAGDMLEAQLMSRALVEYAITFAWFQLDPELHMAQWLIEDIRQTLVLDDELKALEGDGVLEDERRNELEQVRDQLKADCGDGATAMPKLKDRAHAAGFDVAYSLAYRYESKSGIHPTTLAAEQLLTHRPQIGKYEIRETPDPDVNLPDVEGVGAALLLAILEVAQELVPEMPLNDGFADVKQAILALAPLEAPPAHD